MSARVVSDDPPPICEKHAHTDVFPLIGVSDGTCMHFYVRLDTRIPPLRRFAQSPSVGGRARCRASPHGSPLAGSVSLLVSGAAVSHSAPRAHRLSRCLYGASIVVARLATC